MAVHPERLKKESITKLGMTIEINPKVCHGKPVIKGTRIMVANVLSLFAGGYDIKQVINYYPQLKEEQVKEAIQFAVNLLQEEEIKLMS